MEIFTALLAICERNSPVTAEFPRQRPVTLSFDILRLNKRLSKQSWGWWFETLSCALWRHCNVAMKWHMAIIIWKLPYGLWSLKTYRKSLNATVKHKCFHLAWETQIKFPSGHSGRGEFDGLVQEDVTPLLTHWSYVFLALTHRFYYTCNIYPIL